MGCSSGASIVTNGLILNLDVANRKSVLDAYQTSLINTNSWAVGAGSCTGYSSNGEVGEDNRVIGVDPWGFNNVVWESSSLGTNNNDGGFHAGVPSIDKTKLYRFSVWLKRSVAGTTGTFYFGVNSGYNGTIIQCSDGTALGNPYFYYVGPGALTLNQWYLVVGHIYPYTYQGTTKHPDSGWYTVQNGYAKINNGFSGNIITDAKWHPLETGCGLRTFQYYNLDGVNKYQFMYPRQDLCDGNEPTIAELLKGSGIIYDTSGYGNHHTLEDINYASLKTIPISTSPTKFNMTESYCIQRGSALNGASGNTYTVVIWYSTTDGQDLWVRGNGSGSFYLSAGINGTPYYHQSCGTPTNYVDCKPCTDPNASGYKDGNMHMFEAKNVDFSAWNVFQWFGYAGLWGLNGNIVSIQVYNRNLTSDESKQNYNAYRSRFFNS